MLENRKIFYLFIAIVAVRLGFLFFLTHSAQTDETLKEKIVNHLVLKSTDYGYFCKPVDNYFERGMYSYEFGKPFAGRMPGFWIFYFLLRFIFVKNTALTVLIFLQIVTASLAVIVLAKAAFILSNNKKIFWIALLLSTFNLYCISFDIQTQSESFGISAFCFFIYFFVKFLKEEIKKKRNLFFAGLFLTWLIFCRAFTGVLLPTVACLIFIHDKNFNNWIINCAIFFSSFFIIDGIWIIRNYKLFNKVIPLETRADISYGKLYGKPWLEMRKMIRTFGENPAYFEPNTLAKWFKAPMEESDFNFKENFFDKLKFNKDSIVELKSLYHQWRETDDVIETEELGDLIISKTHRYQENYYENNKVKVWFVYPVMRFKNYIFTSGSGYLLLPKFEKLNYFERMIKLICSTYYYFVLATSFLALFLYSVKNTHVKFFIFCVLTNVLVIVFYAKIQENRYFMPVFPAMILVSAFSTYTILSKLSFIRK